MKRSGTFNLYDVVITDKYFENAQKLEHKYLLSFDIDKLLAGFRDTAGVDMKGAVRYPGWESMLIGGHSVGHYMTACAQAYGSLAEGDADKGRFFDILLKMTEGLRECQLAVGTGFIFGAQIQDRGNIELQFDYVEEGKTNIITQSWVPWYTMHKIMAGLVDTFKFTGIELARTVASDLGDWCCGRTSSWSEELRRHVLGIEYGGMNDCLYDLYSITGKDEHARAAHAFDETWLFEKVLANVENALTNRHANTTIPKFVGCLNRYVQCHGKTVDGETVDAGIYLEYAEAFFDMVVNKHTYVTGGNSEWEHFGVDHVLDAERTNCNCETCNTYNMLKLARTLFMMTGKVKYADYYETAYLNAIMSSQDPETGMTTYFQPMATGYFKVYGTEFTKFWCCTGSGMENFTKLSDSLYFKAYDGVIVNQYISSRVKLGDGKVILTQKTDIPVTDKARFTVTAEGGTEMNVYFRLPDWLAGEATVTVNGADYAYETDGGYAIVKGPFANGTEIEVTLPMNVTVHRLPDNEASVAFKYGPVVLSALLGKENMVKTTTGVDVTIPANKEIGEHYAATCSDKIRILNGQTVDEFLESINENLVRCDVNGRLAFILKNTDANLTFVTHYTQHKERYGLYWIFVENDSHLNVVEYLAEKKSGWLLENIIDTVQPGYGQYENDELHEMKELGEGSVGSTSDGTTRYAKANGAFTYRMLVNEDSGTSLLVSFRKEDNGKHVKIAAGDDVIFSETLNYNGTDAEYQLTLPVDGEIIEKHAAYVEANGKAGKAVTLTFSGADGEASARICTFLYTVRSHNTDASLTVDTDEGSVEYDGDEINVYLNKDSDVARASFATSTPYGYVVYKGSVIYDRVVQSLGLDGKYTSHYFTAYAEDHSTSKEHKVTFIAPGKGIRANVDRSLAYFVDCGDHDPSTLSEGDLFGTHNSVTEQTYGADPVTNYEWGLIDDFEDRYKGSRISKGVYTANTWCLEGNGGLDGLPKEASCRYTKNQFENGMDRSITYGFQLEKGKYSVTVGFVNPWGCSDHPTVTAIDGENETVIADSLDLAESKTAEGEVTVSGGKLILKITTEDKAINVTYIKIAPVRSKIVTVIEENKKTVGIIAAAAAAVAAVAAIGIAIFGQKKKK